MSIHPLTFACAVAAALVAPLPLLAADATAPVGGPTDSPDAVEAPCALPENHRLIFNFDPDWTFTKGDVPGAEQAGFDDKTWTPVSLPHTWNDVDTFRDWRSHARKKDKDDFKEHTWEGKAWYRKHFTLDKDWSGREVVLEFQGVRNAGTFWVNGIKVGTHTDQIGPCGLDITAAVKFGADNVIAAQIDSDMLAKDSAGFSYGWSAGAFYPDFGGLFTDARLHILDKLHQTLPLYSNLGTTGIYIHADHLDTFARTSDLTIESQVANDGAAAQATMLSAWVVDRSGAIVAKSAAEAQPIAPGTKTVVTVKIPMTGIHCWEPDFPYLYRVCTALSVEGGTAPTIPDAVVTDFGFRDLTFSAADGLMINGHQIYLKGFAPRTTMEWAVTGIPQDWMTDYDFVLMKADHANFIRPMHVAPRANQVDSADRLGIIMTCPAGNGEGDDPDTAEGRARWLDRLAVMRDVTIYFRNHPSVLFYEASNSGITAAHMQAMDAVRQQWDPDGGRMSGCRGTDQATEHLKGYESQMDGIFRTTQIPAWDAEYARAESPRRVWDKYTPTVDQDGKDVLGGYLKIAADVHVKATAAGTGDGIYEYPQDAFRLNSSEDLALNNLLKYWDRYSLSVFVEPLADRLAKGITVGGAKIIFADSNSHGRMMDTEVARVSGALDAVRLPKEAYFALQVAQNPEPHAHIIGHWNYPAGTVKTVWVAANTDQVTLSIFDGSGKLVKNYGQGSRDAVNGKADRVNHYAFRFDNVAFVPGKIEAVASDNGKEVARNAITTAGDPAAVRLTAVTGPGAWRADGADIAMVDVEMVDAKGQRCPLDHSTVTFSASGAGVFLGGYNSGIQNSTYNDHLMLEDGINRVFARATRTAGTFTITVTREGMAPATITLTSAAFAAPGGLATVFPRRYGWALGPEPKPAAGIHGKNEVVAAAPTPTDANAVLREFNYTGTDGSTLTPPLPRAHIEHDLADGARIYVDKPWTFSGLPPYLRGGDWVQAFNRDAAETTSTDTIQFNANRPCRFYLLVDAANPMPKHENDEAYGWTKMPETVIVNGRAHSIWRSKPMAAGANGYFASNGFGITLAPGSDQYIAVATADKEAP